MVHRLAASAAVVLILLLLPLDSWPKRLPPKPVPPVVSNGVKYETAGNGRDEYVVASDANNGQEMWRVQVFHNRIKPWLETDVQEIYISKLELKGELLLIEDEASRCYQVDLKTKKVRKTKCQ
jgi:hypothetical protein